MEDVLLEVRSRIIRYRDSRINEEATKTSLIQPVLRALGWNIEDLDQVHPEFRRRSTDNPVDYALMVLREPRLFVEAKALGENLDDPRWANQFISYATAAGVKWIVLTNGDEYRIYNAYAEVPVEGKIFRTVRITDEKTRPVETLRLLVKDQIEKNELDGLWKAHDVDSKVRSAIDHLFSPEADQWLINAIRRQAPDLSPSDIRASLRRIRFHLDLPPEPAPSVTSAAVSPLPREKFSGSVSLRDLIQAGRIRPPMDIEATERGQRFTARVETDGRITFRGKSYSSPSTPAVAAVGSSRNGWTFWYFRDENGRLRPIATLRQPD